MNQELARLAPTIPQVRGRTSVHLLDERRSNGTRMVALCGVSITGNYVGGMDVACNKCKWSNVAHGRAPTGSRETEGAAPEYGSTKKGVRCRGCDYPMTKAEQREGRCWTCGEIT